jgi:energy-coupling factor transport system ATP-binding protein
MKQQLTNVNLNIDEGELTLLAGPSGSGKSSLTLLLNGIIPHHAKGNIKGELSVFDKNPLAESVLTMSNSVGMLLQDPDSQLATSRVMDELIFTLEFRGLPREEIDGIYKDTLIEYDIRHLAEHDTTKMSGGEKQLVALAAIMTLNPEIIILDEPTSNLDPFNTRKILEFVARLKEKGKTIILIEHKIDEVFRFCKPDKIILMDKGKIVTHKNPHDIFLNRDMSLVGLKSPTIVDFYLNNINKEITTNLPLTLDDLVTHLNKLTRDQLKSLKESLSNQKRMDMKTDETLLTFDNVVYQYRNRDSVQIAKASFNVNKGEFIAIIGNNGSGKSTLVKHIIGLLKPTDGDVIIDNVNTKKTTAAQLARKVSFLFQNPDNQIFANSVLKEVSYGSVNCGMDKKEAENRAKFAIDSVNLSEFLNQNPLKLSVGQKQRVAVASSLTMEPSIIVLDEPTTGQDATSLKGIMDLMLKEYQKSVTIIMVTHDMSLVDSVANRVIVLSEGKIIADDKTDLIFLNKQIMEKANIEAPFRIKMLNILEN